MTDDSEHVLEALADKVGAPKSGLLDALLARTTDTSLVEAGAEIASSRLVVDCARLYQDAWGWFSTAPMEMQKRVRGVSADLLKVAIHQALDLEKLRQSREGKAAGDGAARAGQVKAASEAFSSGVALRDQAASSMRDAVVGDNARREMVDATVGTAKSVDELARGLTGLSGLLDSWLKSNDQVLLAQLVLANLDADYVTELADAASRVRSTAAAAGIRTGTAQATQAELDRADGINILLLGRIIRAFDAANTINPTVPRLVPISTRRLFNRRSSKKVVAAVEAAPANGGGEGSGSS